MPEVQLTIGHLLRHAPVTSAMGREAAIVDVAQDLLLRHLFEQGVLDAVVLRGRNGAAQTVRGRAWSLLDGPRLRGTRSR